MNAWFSGLEIPQPPDGLRRSALAAATERWSRPATSDRWRRIWESQPLRVAWGAAVVVLVAANLVVPSRTARPRTSASTSDELREFVKLPRLRAGSIAAAPEPRAEIKKEKRT